MIYQEPELTEADLYVLNLIREQRERLNRFSSYNNPRRWLGTLRKATLARAIRGSNSIEGYDASLDEAIAAVEGEPPVDEKTETWLAINGYRSAMTYILQACQDSTFEFGKQFVKSLHFMMIHWDMGKSPGQWRSGEIFIMDDRLPDPVYKAPDHEIVDGLMDELVEYVRTETDTSILVKAAMVHLNLTMIHPFRDGNGRMARALQTLVLAQDGLVHPVFSSIEEWLGKNTPEYYNALGKMSAGTYSPEYSASSWIRFCLTAHYQQANTIIRRHEEYSTLYGKIDDLVKSKGLHERTKMPLLDAALGMRLTNSRYQREAEVSVHVATRDLRMLADEGYLIASGEKRGRHYLGSDRLKSLLREMKVKRDTLDPYSAFEASGSSPSE